MTKKNLFSVALCLFCCIGTHTYTHAQVKTKPSEKIADKFTKEEITMFSKTLLFIKKTPFDVETSFKKAVANSDLPEKRFSEIFNANFAGTDPKITPKEQVSLDNFKISTEKDKAEYDKKTRDFVEKQSFSWTTYEKMLREYSINTSFQRVIANKMQEISYKK